MAETTETPKHHGYAHGSKKLDRETIEKAVKKLLDQAKTEEVAVKDASGQPTGAVLLVKRHETDPPEGFVHPRMVKPGPLPAFVRFEEIDPKALRGASRFEHSVFLAEKDCRDTICYHVARLVVVEARRIHAKSLAVEAAAPGGDGVVVVKVVMIR